MGSMASRAVTVIGIVLLAHACYSAYEHSTLTSQIKASSPASSSPTPSSPPTTSLPLDISLETIISVMLICIGLVSGVEELQPIEWRVWAGKVERDRKGGPYTGLEERMGFVNIRAKRKEFADWVRDQARDGKS